MRRAILWLLVLLLGGGAWGDIVHLKDGTTREGRVVERNDDVVVLEMRLGGVTARVTLRADDIDRIEKKLTDAEKGDLEYRRRLLRLDRTDADAVIAMAEWCAERNRYDDATTLLTALSKEGGEKFRRGTLALATMACDRGRFKTARDRLATLLAKHPTDAAALALLKRLDAVEQQTLAKLLADAKRLYDAGKFDAALRKAESFHLRASPEHEKAAIAKSPFAGVKGFEDFVAETRLKLPCPSCTAGRKVCPVCKGKADAEKGPCAACGGTGRVICSRCDGTGVKSGGVPAWQVPAVARGLEKRIAQDVTTLEKIGTFLAGSPKPGDLVPAGAKAEIVASRARRWIAELDKLARKTPGVTKRLLADDRLAVRRRYGEVCTALADRFGTVAETKWRAIGAAGMLEKDAEVRAVRDDLVRARSFYDRTRANPGAPYPPTVVAKAGAVGRRLAEVEKKVDHNRKMLRAYRIARVAYGRDKSDLALKALVALIENGSREDLAFISKKSQADMLHALDEVTALCRFEVGKEDGKFGTTTSYERSAFIKKLLKEADIAANLAHGDFEKMIGFLDNGRRNDVPTSMTRRTRENAENARRWYRAVFEVPYPISGVKRREIDEEIEELSGIIYRCRRWYRGGRPVTGAGTLR